MEPSRARRQKKARAATASPARTAAPDRVPSEGSGLRKATQMMKRGPGSTGSVVGSHAAALPSGGACGFIGEPAGAGVDDLLGVSHHGPRLGGHQCGCHLQLVFIVRTEQNRDRSGGGFSHVLSAAAGKQASAYKRDRRVLVDRPQFSYSVKNQHVGRAGTGRTFHFAGAQKTNRLR